MISRSGCSAWFAPLKRSRFIASTVLAATVLLAACHQAPRVVRASVDPLGSLTPLAPALYGARLPDRFSDSTYWRMITQFSEPGGYFRSENFVSNEMGLQYVIPRLQQAVPPGGVYVGVGPEQNFTYLAALRPRIAFIVDIRRQNLLQHLWYKAVFELSPTRGAFLSRLFARALPANTLPTLSADSLIVALGRTPADPILFRRTFAEVRDLLVKTHGFTIDSTDLSTLRYVDSVFFSSGPLLNYSSGSGGFGGGGGGGGRGGFGRSMPTFADIAGATDETGLNRGFLGSEASYTVVRDMQRRNLVVPLVGNFSGPKALRIVGAWLKERGAKVTVFYTSNVEQYLFMQGDDWNRFYANVETLPLDTTSAFIRSVTNRGFGGGGFAGRNGNNMMAQLTSPMISLVLDAKTGLVRSYGDVIGRSH